jgi:hypothetical protein
MGFPIPYFLIIQRDKNDREAILLANKRQITCDLLFMGRNVSYNHTKTLAKKVNSRLSETVQHTCTNNFKPFKM